MEYITVSGDTFDRIAYKHYGDEKHAINIIEANIDYAGIVIFGAGVRLNIPDIEISQTSNLPPWKRGNS